MGYSAKKTEEKLDLGEWSRFFDENKPIHKGNRDDDKFLHDDLTIEKAIATLSRIAFDGCPSKVIKKFKVDEHGNEVLVEKTVEFGKLEALKMCLKYLENKVEIDGSFFDTP